MNKLNLMLIASPLEFAAIFGEVTSDVVTEARASTAGLPQCASTVAVAGSANRGTRKSRGVSNTSPEASIQAVRSGRQV
jgi:hypothetical protein